MGSIEELGVVSVLDGVAVSTLLFDENRNVSFVNPMFEQVFGFKKEECVGNSLEEFVPNLVPPESIKLIVERVKKRTESGGVITNFPLTMLTKEIKEVPVLYSAAPIKDKEGKIVGEIVTYTDITELRKREEELRKRQEENANAISALSKVLDMTIKGELTARVDTKGWSEELETIGMAINTLIESLEVEKKEKS